MDEGELAKLYGRYGYGVFRRCAAYLGVDEAPEAMRAVFVRALRGLGPERRDADPRTWLCRIADALCAERLNARARASGRREANASADVEASGFVSTVPAFHGPTVPAPDAVALERAVAADDLDALSAVQRLLPRLEPGLRRLAVLYYLDELSEEELAHELGWSRRTVDKRMQLLIEQARALWSAREAS